MALRRIEHVGPDRDDWRAAVIAFAAGGAAGSQGDAVKMLEQLYAVIQNRDADDQTISGREAVNMIRRASGK